MKNFLLAIFFIFLLIPKVAAQESATQNLSISLPEVLEITKVFADTIECPSSKIFTNINILDCDQSNATAFVLSLTPMYLQLSTNIGTPVIVSADFTQFKHNTLQYAIPAANLAFSPSEQVINNPYDEMYTSIFTPVIITTKGIPTGLYNGSVTFTLGKI